MTNPRTNDPDPIQISRFPERRRRWSPADKIRIIEETQVPGISVSAVARLYGIAPSVLFRWRKLMQEGGLSAISADEPVVGSSEVKQLKNQIRELEHLLGRKTFEVEILKEAVDAYSDESCHRFQSKLPLSFRSNLPPCPKSEQGLIPAKIAIPNRGQKQPIPVKVATPET